MFISKRPKSYRGQYLAFATITLGLMTQLYIVPAYATKLVSDEMRRDGELRACLKKVQAVSDEINRMDCASAGLNKRKHERCNQAAQRLKDTFTQCQKLQTADGQQCTLDRICRSGYCGTGPSLNPNQPGPKYCMSRSLNCAKPGSSGARYNDTLLFQGRLLTCANPALHGWGRRPAQFMLLARPVAPPPGKGPVSTLPPVKKKSDGRLCSAASECGSGYCTPGPSFSPQRSGAKYCLNRNLNCALPNSAGARYGQTTILGGKRLSCINPAKYGWGRLPAQFMLPVRP